MSGVTSTTGAVDWLNGPAITGGSDGPSPQADTGRPSRATISSVLVRETILVNPAPLPSGHPSRPR